MNKKTLKVCEFTMDAYNRYIDDGEGSGEEYRKKYLVPSLNTYDKVEVCLDGINDEYGSSFQVEAFANLIRKDNFSIEFLKKNLFLISQNQNWVKEIWGFIEEANRDVAFSKFKNL
jgi:hypothetical protein